MTDAEDIPTLAADLTAFQRDLLRTVARWGPCRGLAIKAALESSYGDINHGRLYPNLDELADQRLVDKRTDEPDHRSNQYDVTDRGHRLLVYLATSYEDVADGEVEA